MQGELWQDYGTPGTQALRQEEIEQAIARLKRMWDDAQAHAQEDRVLLRKTAAIAVTSRHPDQLSPNVHWS